MEFLLDSIYYLYNYYIVCALLSHTHHVTPSYDVTLQHPNMTCDVSLSCTSFLCSKSR